MNSKYMVMVAAMAVMLIGATALATDNAFADGKKKYGKNQATSQANACGNGKLPNNVFCQNIGSQVQGEENAVAVDGVQSSGEDRHGHSGGNGDGGHGGGNGDGGHGGGNGDGGHGGGNGDGDDW